MRNFRNYETWVLAIKLAKQVYSLTKTFPKKEVYGISSQIQRASVSISSNIAEGCSRKSEKEFAHYLEIAIGSSFEVESQLCLCLELEYVEKETFEMLIANLHIIQRKLNALYTKVRKGR